MSADTNALFLRAMGFKNFLSFGNNETTIGLDEDLITVIMGENLDTGGEDSRNGVGKSAIEDALCYALFGGTLRGISNQKLVNDLARKGQSMVVWVTFDKGGYSYLVERSERPGKLLLLRKEIGDDTDIRTKEKRKYIYDISRNKTETTEEIISLLGFDLTLFSFLVVNTSESDPFFKLPEGKRRDIIEKLFGFTILSERAEKLKEQRKDEKKELIKVETEYVTTVKANERIQTQIADMKSRSVSWEKKKKSTITELTAIITELEKVDVEGEIELLQMASELSAKYKEIGAKKRELNGEIAMFNKNISVDESGIKRSQRVIDKHTASLETLDKSICPTCNQHWEADPEYRGLLETELAENQEAIVSLTATIEENQKGSDEVSKGVADIDAELKVTKDDMDEIARIELTYSTTEEAASAGATLTAYEDQLSDAKKESNPHTESIASLKNEALKDVSDTGVKELKKLIKHYDFLISLLTDKDSYIRKQIIDRWLPKLNQGITKYLDLLDLPHTVKFLPDMSVVILKHNRIEKDYGNLSKGERQRVNIALNFAFQDVFELMNYRINFLAVDELIDNGICNRGAENTVNLLKDMAARKHKRVLLVTHREDIAARVDDMIIVQKENDISRITKAG